MNMIEFVAGVALIAGLFATATVVGAHFVGWKAMGGAWAFTATVVAVASAGSYLIDKGLTG